MTAPRLAYGTAWKKARTADLVYQALKAGFRAIDTACQPKHYEEKLVGDGIRRAISEGVVTRQDLFVQTKFTPPSGQDPNRKPYDFSLPTADQVQTSIQTSLQNLSTGPSTYLDSVLLHSPLSTLASTVTAWKTLSTYVASGQIRQLGISNCPASVLRALLTSEEIEIKPAVVQNRFYPATRWDAEVRGICRDHEIAFQSFWTLTGNPELMGARDGAVSALATACGVERATALYSLVLRLNEGLMTILCGTTDLRHMKEDLEGDEVVRRWAEGEGKQEWRRLMEQFRREIGEVR